MKAQREDEMDQMLNNLPVLQGYFLDQSLYNEKALLLHFSNGKDYFWVCISLKPGQPYFFFTRERLHFIKNKKKPLNLFLKTHFERAEIKKVKRLENLGRVIRFEFEDSKAIQISLIPGRVNIEAEVGDKKIFAYKPKEISENLSDGGYLNTQPPRSVEDFYSFWQKNNARPSKNESRIDVDKDLRKKKKGLAKMEAKLEELQDDEWQKLGEWLNENQSLENAPKNWAELIDDKLDFVKNLERAFAKAKKNKAKVMGTIERIDELKKEICGLESGEIKSGGKKKAPGLLEVAGSKGRTYDLGEAKLYLGKSGTENLKLLRRAKPWYIWLHIKDYPGAHGVIEPIKKKKELSGKCLQEAGLKVVAHSLPKGSQGVFEVIYAECRYVRPIKGAKSGQVTYSHEKVLRLRIEP